MIEKEYTLYHGSQLIIDAPDYKHIGVNKDFGQGFYLTESEELAKQWACASETDGYANKYILKTEGLKVMDMAAHRFSILSWMAMLLQHRHFTLTSQIAEQEREFLLKNFLPRYQRYDVIIGMRGDNCFTAFANAFLNNEMSLVELRRAMKLGTAGRQFVIRSKKGYEALEFQSSSPADRDTYYPMMLAEDSERRRQIRKDKGREKEGTAVYLIDIMRGEWPKYEPRLRGRLPKRSDD